MFKSWRLGKIFAIPIYVHPTFLLIPLLAVLQGPGGLVGSVFMATLVLAVFGCVLLHELGHALMARHFGIGTRDITLYPIGGVARLDRLSDDPKHEMAIAVAGPAVNVAIAALLTPLVLLTAFSGGNVAAVLEMDSGPTGLLAQFLLLLLSSNIVLVLFNMLPAFPMDGGRVLRAVLSMGLGPLRATEIAARIGVVLAVLIGLYALFFGYPMLVILAGFVVFAGQMELLAMRHRLQPQYAEPIYEDAVEPQGPVLQPEAWPREPNFTGYTWDRVNGLWVKWQDGQPVAAFNGPVR